MSLLNQSIIKHKMGLLNLAEELRNVSQACRSAGWLMKLYQVSVVNFAGADRQVALDIAKRLTLNGVEMALLRADFEKFSSAPPTSL